MRLCLTSRSILVPAAVVGFSSGLNILNVLLLSRSLSVLRSFSRSLGERFALPGAGRGFPQPWNTCSHTYTQTPHIMTYNVHTVRIHPGDVFMWLTLVEMLILFSCMCMMASEIFTATESAASSTLNGPLSLSARERRESGTDKHLSLLHKKFYSVVNVPQT